MKCPNCGFEQEDGAECLRCGIVFSKYKRHTVSKHSASNVLGKNGLSLKDENSVSRFSSKATIPKGNSQYYLPLVDKIDFFEVLLTQIRSGTSLLEGLKLVSYHGHGKTLGKFADSVLHLIQEKKLSFYKAVKITLKNSSIFTDALLEIGEKTGRLEDSLNIILSYLKDIKTFMKNLISSLIYPFFVFFLSFVFLPLSEIFKGNLTGYLLKGPLLGVGIIAVAVIIPHAISRSKAVSDKLKSFALKTPFMSSIKRYFLASLFYTIVKTGYSFLEGMDLIINSFAKAGVDISVLDTLKKELVSGKSLADSVALNRLFDSRSFLKIVSGESSGTLEKSFFEIKEAYKERLHGLFKIAGKILTVLITVIIFIFIAINIMDAYSNLFKGTEDMMREIDKLTPIKNF